MIWVITILLLCGIAGCVAIIGDDNEVHQTGVGLEAHTDIDKESVEVEIDEKKGPLKK